MKRIGFLGCGKIGKAILAHVLKQSDVQVMFIQDPNFTNDSGLQCPIISTPDEILLKQTDLVIECATADILKEYHETILHHCDLMMFSVTGFSDSEFESSVKNLCTEYHHQIYIPHGAVLGLDGIFDGRNFWTKVTIETTKSPESLGRSDKERTVLYEGPTREACKLYPRNVNVHAAIALSGIGFDNTQSLIIVEPGKETNDHLITVEGPGVQFQIIVSSYAAGSITGAYTPLSACGSIDRMLGTSFTITNI